METTANRSAYEHVRRAAAERNRLDGGATASRGQYDRVMDEVGKAAVQHALEAGVDPDYDLDNLIERGASLVRDLHTALGGNERTGADRQLVWVHISSPLERVRQDRSPVMDRISLEWIVQGYLDLPYRVPSLDRLLVDVMVALEMFAFADEASGNKVMSGGGPSPLKLRPIRSFVLGQVSNLVVAGIIGALAYAASLLGIYPSSWLPGTCVVLGLLYLLLCAVAVVMFPRYWLAATKARKLALALITQMTGVYSELNAHGPISSRHIERRAQEAASVGISWPAPLFALLDDINARLGRF